MKRHTYPYIQNSCKKKKLDIFNSLIKAMKDKNEKNINRILNKIEQQISIKRSCCEILREINKAETMGGFTLLHHASILGYPHILQLLLSLGANAYVYGNSTGIFNSDHETPLYNAAQLAAINGHLCIIEILYEYESTAVLQSLKGTTPLRLAIIHQKMDIISFLLEKFPEHSTSALEFLLSQNNIFNNIKKLTYLIKLWQPYNKEQKTCIKLAFSQHKCQKHITKLFDHSPRYYL